jgi:hypothetical protein
LVVPVSISLRSTSVIVLGAAHHPPKDSLKEGTMSLATYPTRLEFHGTPQIARWRPLVQWLLAIPHLFIAYALTVVRAVLTLIAFVTVLGNPAYSAAPVQRDRHDLPLRMAHRQLRAVPPRGLLAVRLPADRLRRRRRPAHPGHVHLPEQLSRWRPLVKWLLAVPHYLVLFGLSIAAVAVLVAGFFAVLITGEYPSRSAISWSPSTATACACRPTADFSPTGTRRSACKPAERPPDSDSTR